MIDGCSVNCNAFSAKKTWCLPLHSSSFVVKSSFFCRKKKTKNTYFFQMKSQLFFRLNMFYGVFVAQGWSPFLCCLDHCNPWSKSQWVCLKIVYPYTQWFCWSLSLLNGYNWGYTLFSDKPKSFSLKSTVSLPSKSSAFLVYIYSFGGEKSDFCQNSIPFSR